MMRPRTNLIIAVTVVVAAALIGIRLLRSKAHAHKHDKVTGDASFDVAADGHRIHLLVLRQHGDHQALLHKRIENGGESAETELPRAANEKIISKRSNDVRIAAHGGHVVALWQVAGTGFMNRGPLRFAESFDGGTSWKAIAGPTAANRTDDQGFAGFTADAKGKFHLVWLDLEAKIKGLRYAAYKDGKWSTPETIDAATCQCCWNSIAVNPQGEPIVMYRALKPRDMATARRSSGGWVKEGSVDNFGWQIEACPHAGGGLALGKKSAFAVTWTGHEKEQGTYLSATNGAGKWERKMRLGGKFARNPDIAHAADRLAAVWDEFEGERRMVKLRISPDGGSEWRQEEILTGPQVSGSYPRVVALPQGFTVFWSETQKGGNAGVRYKKI